MREPEVRTPSYCLPPHRRLEFSASLGPAYRGRGILRIIGERGFSSMLCVGDVVSKLCLEAYNKGRLENLVLVVDGITRRGETVTLDGVQGFTVHIVKNVRGSLSLEVASLVCRLLETGGLHVVNIDGEEDLVALAAMLCPRPGWGLAYGLPGVGAVLVSMSAHPAIGSRVLGLEPCIV